MTDRESLQQGAVSGLQSLRVVLGIDSPETRGWAPLVQQEARRAIDCALAVLAAGPHSAAAAQPDAWMLIEWGRPVSAHLGPPPEVRGPRDEVTSAQYVNLYATPPAAPEPLSQRVAELEAALRWIEGETAATPGLTDVELGRALALIGQRAHAALEGPRP